MHNHNYFRVQKFQNMKFEKFSLEICLWKFQKKLEVSYLTRGTICQKWDTRRPPGTKIGCPTRPDSLAAWDPPILPPGGVRWVSCAHLLPLDRKPLPGIFFSNFPELVFPAILGSPSLGQIFQICLVGLLLGMWLLHPSNYFLFLCLMYEVFCCTRCDLIRLRNPWI